MATDVLREFFSEGALGALARGLPTQIVVGPEAGWLLLSMQAELRKKQEAARLAGDLRRAAGRGVGLGRLRPIKRPAVTALPPALDDDADQAVHRPLQLSFSYGQALEQHREDGRELWLLSADYLREMPLAGGGMQMHLQSLSWPVGLRRTSRKYGEAVGSVASRAATNTNPARLAARSGSRRFGPRDGIGTIGHSAARANAARIHRCCDAARNPWAGEEFGTLDRGHPARVLECIEWRGRERNHSCCGES